MKPEQLAQLALTIMTVLGFLLVGGYFVTARTRSYLLYLGLSFFALGVLAISTGLVRWITFAIFLVFFIVAAVVAFQDTKERLRALRQEHANREAAFAEFLKSTVGKDEGEDATEPVPENDSPVEPEEAG
ncbi:MAG TPA: hypothetical protein VGM23_02100 [Armatimonadota bacterium]